MLEGRREQFVTEVVAAEGGSRDDAAAQVDASIDRWVWYAGWADKLAQVLGGANAVSGPYFDFSVPEPTGVIAVVAPPGSSLLGLVSVLAPVIVSGNTAVVVTSHRRPIPAMTLAEVLATSDLPAGVVNLLTGDPVDMVPSLAAHTGVHGIDLTGVEDPDLATGWEREAAVNLKRVRRPGPVDWSAEPGLTRMTTFIETKTVWHPIGADHPGASGLTIRRHHHTMRVRYYRPADNTLYPQCFQIALAGNSLCLRTVALRIGSRCQ